MNPTATHKTSGFGSVHTSSIHQPMLQVILHHGQTWFLGHSHPIIPYYGPGIKIQTNVCMGCGTNSGSWGSKYLNPTWQFYMMFIDFPKGSVDVPWISNCYVWLRQTVWINGVLKWTCSNWMKDFPAGQVQNITRSATAFQLFNPTCCHHICQRSQQIKPNKVCLQYMSWAPLNDGTV